MASRQEVESALRRETMSFKELAELLRLHPAMQSHSSTIYRLLRQGKYRAFKVGSKWGFSRESIERLVNESGK